MKALPRSLARTGAPLRLRPALCASLCLASLLLAAPAARALPPLETWPVVVDAAPDAGGADAVVIWLDAAPGDADAAADRALLAAPAMERALAGFSPHRLPWPQGGVQNPVALSAHAALADRWAIKQLPAWVLLDPTGRMFARFDDGRPLADDPAAAAARLRDALDRLKKRDELLEAAASAEGLEKAKLLGAAIEKVEAFAIPDHAEIIEEILRLDPDDRTGLRSRWFLPWSEPRVESRIGLAVFPLIELGRFARAREALLEVRDVEPLPAPLRRRLDVFAAQLLQSAGDLPGARRDLQKVIEETPAGAEADAYRELLSTMSAPEPAPAPAPDPDNDPDNDPEP